MLEYWAYCDTCRRWYYCCPAPATGHCTNHSCAVCDSLPTVVETRWPIDRALTARG